MVKSRKKEGGFDLRKPVAIGLLGVLGYGAYKHYTREKKQEKSFSKAFWGWIGAIITGVIIIAIASSLGLS